MSILLLNKVRLLSFSFVMMSPCNLSISLQGELFSVPFKHCHCSLHTENVANSQYSSLGVFSPAAHTKLHIHPVSSVGYNCAHRMFPSFHRSCEQGQSSAKD